jgi:hypothetical protein
MALHRHKVRSRPGAAEWVTTAVAVFTVATMVAGPMALPSTSWRDTPGSLAEVYLYQNASTPDGRPLRVRASYHYEVDGKPHTGAWDGDWPAAHSINALPPADIDRLREPGYPVHVFYDISDPDRSTLHIPGNRMPSWWLRLSIALAVLVLWYGMVVYPRLKSSR